MNPRARMATLVAAATAVVVSLAAAADPDSLDLRRQVVDGRYLIQHWDLSDGLPQSSITDVAQDHSGFLWLATFGGLVRFDGLEFRSLGGAPTSVGWNPRMTALATATDGSLWVGLQSGGVARLVDGRFEDVEQPDGLRNATVWDLAAGSRGLLAAVDGGAWMYTGGRWVDLAPPVAGVDPTGLAVAWDSEGGAWVGGPGSLYRFSADGSPRPPSSWALGATALQADDQGGVWIGGPGAMGYAQGEKVWTHPELSPGVGRIVDVVTDGEGDLWIVGGTTIRLLGHEPEVRRALMAGDPPPVVEQWETPSTLRCGFADRERNLWVGSDGHGFWRFGRQEFVRFGAENGLPDHSVGVMVGDGDGGLWVAASCSGLVHLDDGQFSGAPADLPRSGCCSALLHAGDGSLWTGCGNRVSRFEAEEGVYREIRSWETTHAVLAIEESDEGVWVGTAGGGALLLAGDTRTAFDSTDCLGGDHVSAIARAPDGSVWLGHRSGSTRIRAGECAVFDEESGHPPGSVRALLVDPDGTTWIGTYGGGLARFRDGSFQRYTSNDGLFDDVVSRILDDGQGWLWMNGNRGVFRIRRADLDAHAAGTIEALRCTSFPTGEGNGGSQPAGWRDEAGRLWFPTIDGVVSFSPRDVQLNAVPPVLHVESARLDDTALSTRSITRVPPGHGNLEVHFTAPSLRRPDLTRFEHRFVGEDKGWVSAGASRVVRYAQLPPGDHVLEIRAVNEDDIPSAEPQRLAFHLDPHFYQAWWFTVLLAGVLIAIGSGMGLARARKLREHNRALEAEIRTREKVQAEKRQLERRLANAQQLEALGRLAGGIAHDFNNTLTVVEGNADLLRLVLKPEPDTRIDRCIHEIVECSHRANRMIRQLLAFGRKQTLESEVLDPGEVIENLQSMFRRLLRDDVELRIEVEPGAGLIFADRSQAEQALANLLINAGDAMPTGGTVTVTVARAQPELVARDHPDIVLDGDHVRVSIEDTGEGIPPEILPRIFEPFFSTKPVGQGTGLGLASVHGFVTQSHGHMGVVSEVDTGSRFDIFMPCAEGEAAEDPSLGVEDSLPWGSETIVLCDDDDMVRHSMAGVLEAQGYQVLQASRGARALELLTENRDHVAALVTDVVMPEINGPDLALQARFILPNIRVLFVTGYALDVELWDKDDDLADVLPKPFSAAALLQQLRELLDR